MKFGHLQEMKFESLTGAYSEVTKRENVDSQITLTDYEVEIATHYFGLENIPVGNVQSNKIPAAKTFRLFPGGDKITLNLVYPKPEKTELRLYISSSAGFKPEAGDIWFIFIRNSDIWIGSMNETSWRSDFSEFKLDESDEVYQMSVNDTDAIRTAKLKERDIYARDRKIALQRMELSGYTCDFDTMHNLFISRFSRKPYLEAHHLVPMGLQKVFTKPLDTIHNVYCLCPFCHRAVHHAEETVARDILNGLAARGPVLDEFSLSVSDLFSLYAVEEID